MSIVNVLHSKDAINSNYNVLVMEVCIGSISISKVLFIVGIVISILLETTFSQISIHSQLLVKLL